MRGSCPPRNWKEELNKLEFQGWWWGIPKLKGKKNEVVQMLRGEAGIKGSFRECEKEKVFEILGGDTLLRDDWKCGGDPCPLWGLYIQREKEAREEKKKKETFWGEKKRFSTRKIEKEERGGQSPEVGLILLNESALRYDCCKPLVLLHCHMFSFFSCYICGLFGWVWMLEDMELSMLIFGLLMSWFFASSFLFLWVRFESIMALF